MDKKIRHFDGAMLAELLPLDALISHLAHAMLEPAVLPVRSRLERGAGREMLIMPVAGERFTGVKMLNVIPDNPSRGLPAIEGLFTLFDGANGQPLASMEASELTGRRTAALSALASRQLSRDDSKSLLVLGTGHLAPYMAEAHAKVRSIETVKVWGRSLEKAQNCQSKIARRLDCIVEAIAPNDLENAVGEADIISAATRAQTPLIKGAWLKPGVHVDLVGGYRPDMREIDDEGIAKTRVFVDNLDGVLAEAGDILTPIKNGSLSQQDIVGDIGQLLAAEQPRRPGDITLFKSVGSAACDLAAASLAYQRSIEHSAD